MHGETFQRKGPTKCLTSVSSYIMICRLAEQLERPNTLFNQLLLTLSTCMYKVNPTPRPRLYSAVCISLLMNTVPLFSHLQTKRINSSRGNLSQCSFVCPSANCCPCSSTKEGRACWKTPPTRPAKSPATAWDPTQK